MNLREAILKEHSKAQGMKIAGWIGDNEKRFALLMNLFLKDEYRVVQRAAWIVSMVADRHPKLLLPHLSAMVKRMEEQNLPVAVKRNVVRVLQNIPIPKKLQGMVMNLCFHFLADPKETVAVRCFSMTVLGNLSKVHPEVKNELTTIVKATLEQKCSAGFHARARKVLKEIDK